MRNTVLDIQAKVHPATASISVKFRAMKEDIDITWIMYIYIIFVFTHLVLIRNRKKNPI